MSVKKHKRVKKVLNTPKVIANNIPYLKCYEEGGMFESEPGVYSRAYLVSSIESENIKDYNNTLVTQRFGELLNSIPSNMTTQFIIHNRLISQDTFLKKVYILPDKEDEVNGWIKKYNETIKANSDIGHNNVKKNKYFVLSTKAACPEEALSQFEAVDQDIKLKFDAIYGIKIETLSAVGRLKVMYSMFNPLKNDFGKKADLRGDGKFTLQDMKKLKLSTKDVIAPASWDFKQKDYMVFDDSLYTRAFFIANLPLQISNNLISDITNVSSNMVFSAIYEPVDTKYGLELATQRVSENLVIRESLKRDTIKDRRERGKTQTKTMIRETEQAYFDNAALSALKESVARGDKAELCSFVIVLYAEDLETLDRDTKLLYISTSKFACQVKPLDLQQMQGFWSVLPLGRVHVDVSRLMSVHKLSTIPPLNIQEVLQKDGQFYGLNAINDKLILLNRKNNPAMSGIIAGTEHTGKTYQTMREAFNALISTTDKVKIVTESDEYDGFAAELGGRVIERISADPFDMVEHYGLVNADRYSKSLMLEALLDTASAKDEKTGISEEVEALFEGFAVGEFKMQEILEGLKADPEKYPILNRYMGQVEGFAVDPEDKAEGARLEVYKVHSLSEKVLLLDHLWNEGIRDKMNNTSTWVFVDAVDDLLNSEQCASFLLDYVEKMDAIKNVLTMVIQSSVKLFTDNTATYWLEDLIKGVGYHKLLNQGAIERKKYTEILNISNTLVNYITAAELGRGIILTSANNCVFDDNFYTEDEAKDSFYALFKK